mmetsp:Transcript_5058/g.16114  ORF Transcript_5058/g.16114 Transcript_5058/m.16114 type:complete len:200 (+) Transcript_5058:893-1492(+)
MAYTQSATRLFSAAADATLVAHDPAHSYTPIRAHAASPTAPLPCTPTLAVAPGDGTLVAGGMQLRAVLLLDASSLLPIATVPLGSDATALAFGRNRMLFAATQACELVVLRLLHENGHESGGCDQHFPSASVGGVPHGAAHGAIVTSVISSAHTSAAAAIAISPHGTLLASGGTDCSVRVWDAAVISRRGARPAPPHQR